MNFTRITLMLLAIFIAGSISSYAVITGSKHDFSSKSWNSTGEICIVCHTPHNASTSVTNAPLWNHAVTAATFTLYANTASMNATIGQPSASSKLCLSCHDGTVALENFGTMTTGTNYATGIYNLGTSLANDHPISFTYDVALATTDGELARPDTTSSGLGGSIDSKMLFANKMECASCHDVHNKANITHLLVKSNAASALCLTCHKK